MIAAVYTVCLTVQGPVLTHGLAQGRFGVDAVMVRDRDGRCYLPGSLIKGLINEAWQELSCADSDYDAKRVVWFGQESSPRSGGGIDEPRRGHLFFEDLVDSAPGAVTAEVRYRIEIDAARGAVEHGHYLVIDTPYLSGQQVQFVGTLRAMCHDEAEADLVQQRVQTALRWTATVGAERSVGFGRVLDASCTRTSPPSTPSVEGGSTAPANAPHPQAAAVVPFVVADLVLRFRQPLCFSSRRTTDNLFESESWISGGALKGALANQVALDPQTFSTLIAHLHAVRFTHALPTTDNGAAVRPTYPPLSLLTVDEVMFYDALHLTQEQMLMQGDQEPFKSAWDAGKAPAFDTDWKHAASTIRARFGWAKPETEVRMHTAVDGGTRRAAEDKLFAYEMIVPQGVVWRSQVSLWGVPVAERGAVARELEQALTSGLFALGKTKAHADVEVSVVVADEADDLDPAPTLVNKATVALTLQSAALLCAPQRSLLDNRSQGSTERAVMWQEYATVWRDLSDGSLELRNYFHRLTLAGGNYLWHRFQGRTAYRPYLLTEAGSVFLLTVTDAGRAQDKLHTWRQKGLPLMPAVKNFYSLTNIANADLWKHCPYLPENGFGEVARDVQRDGIPLLRAVTSPEVSDAQ